MTGFMTVTYFHQSAFAVAVGKTLLLFSYHELDLEQMPEEFKVSEQDFKGFNNILVFVPFQSAEHLDPVIFTWKPSYPITYIVSSDAENEVPKQNNVHIVKEGDSFSIADASIRVCGATGSGVSYLVKTHDISIFHAGDLNLWHWREENTPLAIARAEEAFYQTVEKIPHEPLDVCFFPLDPNQGGVYEAGANHVIMSLKPRVFFPMHFGSRGEIAEDYARRMYTRRTNVFALTSMRETAQIDLSQNPPTVISARRNSLRGTQQEEKVITLNTYLEENPFAETDLPVNLSNEKEE